MPRIIAIHEYTLKPSVSETQFEAAVEKARSSGLFNINGLIEYHFIKGIKGERKGHYAAIWIYKDRKSWEAIWGTLDKPKTPNEYPPNWIMWEGEILKPLLDRDPDKIHYTSYIKLDY